MKLNKVLTISLVVFCQFSVLLELSAEPIKFLFDASHEEMSGNADWIIDADNFNLPLPAYGVCPSTTNESNPQQIPSPAQSGIDLSTIETYWTGGISAWGVDLVQAGHTVESLPPGAAITYGDAGNTQDLSLYDVFIVCEPQIQFTAAEKTAILNFVGNGGGLFMVGDHDTSDRNCSGWDSPAIWNDLGSLTHFGIFFHEDGIDQSNPVDWFTDATDNNVSTDLTDPIIYGPAGDGIGGLGLFGSTSLLMDPTQNPTVRGHVWKTEADEGDLDLVTFATAEYGLGRVAAVGDSSPADDGTGDSGDNLYDGWDKAINVNNDIIFLNASYWLAGSEPDTTPPVIESGPSTTSSDCHVVIAWVTDEFSNSTVEYGLNLPYSMVVSAAQMVKGHEIVITGLTPSETYHYRVGSEDARGNGPTWSADDTFSTGPSQAPSIISGPAVTNITGTSAVITWETDEPATSVVDYGLTASYDQAETDLSYVIDHAVTLTGLDPTTEYHYQVSSTDSCAQGPTSSPDDQFTTTENAIDLSGWSIHQANSTQSYTFGSVTLPAGAYLILARNIDKTSFESTWGVTLSDSTVYINSAEVLPMINGDETFELRDNDGIAVDGPTVAMSGSAGWCLQRINPGDPALVEGSWNRVSYTEANPGSGAGTLSGAGVVINEFSDSGVNYIYEFVELYYDVASGTDNEPPTAYFASPQDSDNVSGSVTVKILATDESGISTVQTRYSSDPTYQDITFNAQSGFWEDTLDTESYSDGALTLYGRAVDASPQENEFLFSIQVTVDNSGGSNLADYPVISEFCVDPFVDEFIEIYNPLQTAVDVSAWTVAYAAKTQNPNSSAVTYYTFPASTSLAAGSYYLIACDDDPTVFGVAADGIGIGQGLGNSGGHIVLRNSSGTIIDKVGYGAASYPESAPIGSPDEDESNERKPGELNPTYGNGIDTNNNSDDFLMRATPEPQNTGSTPEFYPGTIPTLTTWALLFITVLFTVLLVYFQSSHKMTKNPNLIEAQAEKVSK
ncbi:lamin tail domain-containing protein [candidate division CSSED10-310 bacterium]|uniref:Lamin tail domain-containing protein n=1 Tax=candidate division CSSED10-310 bacterium TaxID=2855610 RepID=A0ABV6Z4E4_UNCC1